MDIIELVRRKMTLSYKINLTTIFAGILLRLKLLTRLKKPRTLPGMYLLISEIESKYMDFAGESLNPSCSKILFHDIDLSKKKRVRKKMPETNAAKLKLST